MSDKVNDGIGGMEQFLLLCNSFTEHRCSLLAGVNDVLKAYGYSEALGNNILQLLHRFISNVTMSYGFESNSKQNALIDNTHIHT